MNKKEKLVIDRILSWSNRDNYFDDVYRTLLQTGMVYVCSDDLFELRQRLEQLEVPLNSLEITSNYGGYFIKMGLFKHRKKAAERLLASTAVCTGKDISALKLKKVL
jgi:hypothetical protein